MLEAALTQLADAGHRLAVCTNKLEWLSVRLLDTLNLSRHFAAICGQDTFGVMKPDPEILRQTILRASAAIRPRRSWSAIPEPTCARRAPQRCR